MDIKNGLTIANYLMQITWYTCMTVFTCYNYMRFIAWRFYLTTLTWCRLHEYTYLQDFLHVGRRRF